MLADDELTVLMIADQGGSLAAIGRWKQPVKRLTQLGLMTMLDPVNYVITGAGRIACKEETEERDGAFKRAIAQRMRQVDVTKVSMCANDRPIAFELYHDPQFFADVCTVEFLKNRAGEPEIVHLMARVLREGDFAVDVGANIGLMTLIMSRLVGPQGHVEAFEPEPVNFKKLRANLRLNKIENVNVVNRPAWDKEESVRIYTGHDTGIARLVKYDEALMDYPTQALTLDSWFDQYDSRIRLLKIDAEGSELHILRGAERLLRKGIDFVTCEVNEQALEMFGSTQEALREYAYSQGYLTFALAEDGSEPRLLHYRENLEGARNKNILFSVPYKVKQAWSTPSP